LKAKRFAKIIAGPGFLRTSILIDANPVRIGEEVEERGKVFQAEQVKLPA
jgi:hypothetical protein